MVNYASIQFWKHNVSDHAKWAKRLLWLRMNVKEAVDAISKV